MKLRFKKYLLDYIQCNPQLQMPFYFLKGRMEGVFSIFRHVSVGCDDDRFLFIVGSGRSGNTLLRRLLMDVSEIYIPPESYVLGSVVSSSVSGKYTSWEETVDICLSKLEYHPQFFNFELPSLSEFALKAKAWPKKKCNIGQLFLELYRWIGFNKKVEFSWVGDKTPLNTLNLGLVGRMFSKSKFVYLERDAVDVVSSYVNAGIYASYEEAAFRWVKSKKAWKKFRKRLNNDRWIEIKYETLVVSPEPSVKNIVDKFEIPIRSKYFDSQSVLGDVNKLAHHQTVNAPPNTFSIGKGRDSLDKNFKKKLAKILNKELVRSGYQEI